VQVPGFDGVLRLPRPGSAPSLVAEAAAVRAAALVQAGPPLLAESPTGLLIAHQPGHALTPADLHQVAVRSRLCGALGRLHCAAPPANRLDLAGWTRTYRLALRQSGTAEPAEYGDLLAALSAIEQALAVRPTAEVAAHGDAVPDNFVDDGRRVHVIDLEYAVRAEPWFDLATLLDSAADTGSAELAFALVADYIANVPSERPVDALVARVRAWRLLARATWWPWAMLPQQQSIPRAEQWRDLPALCELVERELPGLADALTA